MQPPKCQSILKRKTQHNHPFIQRPDIDNLQKFVFDSLNGILWKDDSQIVVVLASKMKTGTKKGFTEIYVAELDSPHPNLEMIRTILDAQQAFDTSDINTLEIEEINAIDSLQEDEEDDAIITHKRAIPDYVTVSNDRIIANAEIPNVQFSFRKKKDRRRTSRRSN